MRIDIFLHDADTDRLTEISRKLDELLLWLRDEGRLKEAADKLHVSTRALAAALAGSIQKPKE